MENPAIVDFNEAPPSMSEFRRIVRQFMRRRVVVFSLIIIFATIIVAIFAPLLAPYNPYLPNPDESLLQPSREHLLGTDLLGRDTLSRMMYGARTALEVGVVAIGIAGAIGMTLGLIAGYFGGFIHLAIMRVIDALMAFPLMLAALVLAVLLGGGLANVMIAIGVSLSSVYCRLMCGLVLTIKQNDYVLASRSIGATNLRIMLWHVLPNCFPPLIVLITLNMGGAILAEAGLSFLGIGIAPPGAAWGSLVSDGYRYLLSHPVLAIAPGIAIMLLVYAFNIAGDGLRDALDPRLRGTL
jgi:peptide/nickel transport system permease protein